MHNNTHRQELVYSWLNSQIKALKIQSKSLFDSRVVITCAIPNKIHIFKGLKLMADILGIPFEEVEWDGNESTGSNYVERSFMFRGYKIFELKTAEQFNEEDEDNEEAEITD